MDQLLIIAKWKVHNGRAAEFKALVAECMSVVKRQTPDILQYDWYFNESRMEYHLQEKYADSNSFLSHLGDIGELLGKLIAVADLEADIYGDPSQAVLDATAAVNKTVYSFSEGVGQPLRIPASSLS